MDLSKLSKAELDAYLEVFDDVCLWAETFLRDPQGTLHGPLKLNYVQRTVLEAKRQINAIRVHRRAGKSYMLAIYALWFAITKESSQVLIICPDKDKVEALFNTLEEFLRVSDDIVSSVASKRRNPFRMEFTNGSTIAGFTTDARSNSKAQGVRGQTADLVIVDEAAFLNEDDWTAIDPIMMGDDTRLGKVITFVASTPTQERGRYFDICTKDQSDIPVAQQWYRVHIPVTENPFYSKEAVAMIRSLTNEATFNQEWLADFPDVGQGVFRPSYVGRAQRAYSYYDTLAPQTIQRGPIRTMGVDWDKWQGNGPNIVCLELDLENHHYKVCYHEEIPPSEYCLTLAVDRIVELNYILNPTHIYVDRGYGETQVELLHLYGKNHPDSGLIGKVKGISFADSVTFTDPVLDEQIKRRIKPVMVGIVTKWLEDDKLIYPASHKDLTRQLLGFRVLATTDNTIRYTDKDEHIIDALSLASWAMYENYADPFAFAPATQSYWLPVPIAVPAGDQLVDQEGVRVAFGAILDGIRRGGTDFGRRKLPLGRGGNRNVQRAPWDDERPPPARNSGFIGVAKRASF